MTSQFASEGMRLYSRLLSRRRKKCPSQCWSLSFDPHHQGAEPEDSALSKKAAAVSSFLDKARSATLKRTKSLGVLNPRKDEEESDKNSQVRTTGRRVQTTCVASVLARV